MSQLPQDAARRLAGLGDATAHVFGQGAQLPPIDDIDTAPPAERAALLQLAALCWTHETTRGIPLDPRLARVFAGMLRIGAAAAVNKTADEFQRIAMNALERERVRLAACGVAAMSDTPESRAKFDKLENDYADSASLRDVLRRVDECLLLREYVDANEHYVATVGSFDPNPNQEAEAAAQARYSAACDALRAWRAKQPGAADVQPMPEQPQ